MLAHKLPSTAAQRSPRLQLSSQAIPPGDTPRPCLQGAQAVLQAAHRHIALRQHRAQLPRLLLQGCHAVVQQAALRGGRLQALRQSTRLLLALRAGRCGWRQTDKPACRRSKRCMTDAQHNPTKPCMLAVPHNAVLRLLPDHR